MSLRILVGYEEGCENDGPHQQHAVMWDSVTETAFGQTFRGTAEGDALARARMFLLWCDEDRGIPDLRACDLATIEELQTEWFRYDLDDADGR